MSRLSKSAMNNNRKYIRRRAADYFLVTDLDSGRTIGRLMNLSPNGMMVVGDFALISGQTYRLKIRLPEKVLGQDFLFLEVECRWDVFNKRSEWWEHGLEMRDIAPEYRPVIQQVVLNLMDNADGSAPKHDPSDDKLEYIRMRRYR